MYLLILLINLLTCVLIVARYDTRMNARTSTNERTNERSSHERAFLLVVSFVRNVRYNTCVRTTDRARTRRIHVHDSKNRLERTLATTSTLQIEWERDQRNVVKRCRYQWLLLNRLEQCSQSKNVDQYALQRVCVWLHLITSTSKHERTFVRARSRTF